MKKIVLFSFLFVYFLAFSQKETFSEDISYSGINKYRTEGNYSLVKKKGKFGIYNNKTKKLIIPYKYSKLSLFKTKDSICIVTSYYTKYSRFNKYAARKASRQFLIDKSNKIISNKYDYFKPFNNDLTIASYKNDTIEYNVIVNSLGKEISKRYKRIENHKDLNFFIIKNQNGNYGALDYNIHEKIPFIYQYLYTKKSKNKSVIIAKKDDKYGIINSKNKIIIPFEYNSLGLFFEDKFIVNKNGKSQIRNFKNEIILDTSYEIISKPDTNGNYLIRKNSKYGVINNLGKIIIQTEYKKIFSNKNTYQYYYVKSSLTRKIGLYDKKGNIQIPIEYQFIEKIEVYSKRLLAKKENKYGVIDFNNNIIIPIEYDKIKPFKNSKLLENISKTAKPENKKLIDKFLKVNLYEVEKGENIYLINENGNKITINKN